jgi:hypothetical protein
MNIYQPGEKPYHLTKEEFIAKWKKIEVMKEFCTKLNME